MDYLQQVTVGGKPAEIIVAPVWYDLALIRFENGEEEYVSMDKIKEEE